MRSTLPLSTEVLVWLPPAAIMAASITKLMNAKKANTQSVPSIDARSILKNCFITKGGFYRLYI